MSLKRWLDEGRLRSQRTSAKEIEELLRLVDRDLADAQVCALSAARRFVTAYNAVRRSWGSPKDRVQTISIRAEGKGTSRTMTLQEWSRSQKYMSSWMKPSGFGTMW